MHSTIRSIALASLLIAGPVQAQVFDLRDFHESLDGTLAQVPGNLWTDRYGDADGGLLPLLSPGVYGYACGTCTQIGQLVNTGDSAWNGTFGYGSAVTPASTACSCTRDRVPHRASRSSSRRRPTSGSTGVTIDAEMVLNGLAGDGVDITVSHTRDGITTALGARSTTAAGVQSPSDQVEWQCRS